MFPVTHHIMEVWAQTGVPLAQRLINKFLKNFEMRWDQREKLILQMMPTFYYHKIHYFPGMSGTLKFWDPGPVRIRTFLDPGPAQIEKKSGSWTTLLFKINPAVSQIKCELKKL